MKSKFKKSLSYLLIFTFVIMLLTWALFYYYFFYSSLIFTLLVLLDLCIIVFAIIALRNLLVIFDKLNMKPIRLSVAGVPGTGKTILIFSMLNLFDSEHVLAGKFLKINRRNKEVGTCKKWTDIKRDVKESIKGGRTIHNLNDDLYNNEYRFRFLKEPTSILKRLLKIEDEIDFHIKNIPGEMFSTYFLNVQRSPNELFKNFIQDDAANENFISKYNNNIRTFLDEYEKEVTPRREPYEDLKNGFILFYESAFPLTNASPELQISRNNTLNSLRRNFFSFLFFFTSTDFLICEDIPSVGWKEKNIDAKTNNGLGIKEKNPSEKENEIKQENDQHSFITQIYDNLPEEIQNKINVYYAFTKIDEHVDDPKRNFLNSEVITIENFYEKYFDMVENLLSKIYNNDAKCINPGIRDRLLYDLKVKSFFKNEDALKYVFFITTNFDVKSQSFLPFRDWNENDFISRCLPFGTIELFVSILHRNGFYDYKYLEYRDKIQDSKYVSNMLNYTE